MDGPIRDLSPNLTTLHWQRKSLGEIRDHTQEGLVHLVGGTSSRSWGIWSDLRLLHRWGDRFLPLWLDLWDGRSRWVFGLDYSASSGDMVPFRDQVLLRRG